MSSNYTKQVRKAKAKTQALMGTGIIVYPDDMDKIFEEFADDLIGGYVRHSIRETQTWARMGIFFAGMVVMGAALILHEAGVF